LLRTRKTRLVSNWAYSRPELRIFSTCAAERLRWASIPPTTKRIEEIAAPLPDAEFDDCGVDASQNRGEDGSHLDGATDRAPAEDTARP
jgi:hypothetical protein